MEISPYLQFGALGVLAYTLMRQSKAQDKRDKSQAEFLDTTITKLVSVIESNASTTAGHTEAIRQLTSTIAACETNDNRAKRRSEGRSLVGKTVKA
jgi:hypothetical protein